MNVTRKLPIGVQSFKDLREKHFLYVDKTDYAARLANNGKVYFLSRPRRFGKSLFLSTLAAYFLGQKELFKGLYLEQAEEELAAQENRTAWQEYPVLYLDFNTGRYDTKRSLTSQINLSLSQFEEVYGTNKNEEEVAQRFAGVIKRAYQQTGKQVVILVDEYDKP
ncbi:MAG: AAA family ATPase, partial [Treponema sp.]